MKKIHGPKGRKKNSFVEITAVKKCRRDRHWWLMLVFLATQEAEIRRIWFEASQGK
jgi:hypothetical protein